MRKKWYSIAAKAVASDVPQISIFDDIGAWGVTAKDFIAEIRQIDAPDVDLHINSIGGSVFDAIAMYSALRQHPANIHVTVMGVAASAGSLVAMAGDTITMPENTFMMIHNPLNGIYGNADDMRGMADVLDKIAGGLVATYVARTGQDEEKIREMLNAETVLNAQEALALGFADKVTPALKVTAAFDLERLPEPARAAFAASSTPAAQAAGRGDLARSIVAKAAIAGVGAHVDAILLDAEIDSDVAADQAVADVKEIIALCKAVNMPDRADALIRARVPVASVRTRLQQERAALDALSHTDGCIAGASGALAGIAIWDKAVFSTRQTKE